MGRGRYRLGAPLGAGGTAKVYRGFDLVLGVERAVKILRGDRMMREEMRPRLQAEARMMASLRHPNILSVYDVGDDEDCDWVVMEIAEGGSLDDRLLRQGRLSLAETVDYGLQILSGLGGAHAAGIVHRDIKPQNVLVDATGTARIADFGIALFAHGGERLTQTGVSMGSFAYMPPEQRLDARRVDATADIYAVGTTLYVLLTGRTPVDLFAADDTSGRWNAIPAGLAAVIRRATRFDPKERYGSALEMAQALADAAGREVNLDRFPALASQAVFSTTTLPNLAAPTMFEPVGTADTYVGGIDPTAIPGLGAEPSIAVESPTESPRRSRFRQVVLAAFVFPVLLFGPTILYFWSRPAPSPPAPSAKQAPVVAPAAPVAAPAPVDPAPAPAGSTTAAVIVAPSRPVVREEVQPVAEAPVGIGLAGHASLVGTWVTSDVGANLFLRVGADGPAEARVGATWESAKPTHPEMAWRDGNLVLSGVSVYNVWSDVVFSEFHPSKIVGATTGESSRPVTLHRLD